MNMLIVINDLSYMKVCVSGYKFISNSSNSRRLFNEKHNFGVNNSAYMIISLTSSNIILTLTDLVGNVVYVCCSGYVGMDGRRRKRSFWAAENLGNNVGRRVLILNLSFVFIILETPTNIVVSSAIRGLIHAGVKLLGVHYRYCLPHNGCRGRKTNSL